MSEPEKATHSPKKSTTRSALRWLFAPLRHLLIFLAAIVLVFEEWGWVPLKRAVAAIGRLPMFNRLEGWVRGLRPAGALALFALPTLLLLPVKLAALALIHAGQTPWGVGILITGKLIGTALLARIFELTQPALMQLAWFARLYARWHAWKESVLQAAKQTWVWQQVGRARMRLRASVRSAWAAWKQR